MTFNADGNFTITGPTKIFCDIEMLDKYRVGYKYDHSKFGKLQVIENGIERDIESRLGFFYYVTEPVTESTAGVETV